ncbi:hypothetical protein [Bacillus mycoides]|uniref:hypothetical protein n=1 Tax=Bacillus mycoides TaxID=1405 RepID=UPI003CFEDAE4
MANIKIIAEVLSIGLQIGLFSKTEIIDWADQTIEALDSPSIEIIEVSLSSNDKLVDIVPKLKNVKGTYDKKLPVKIILGLLWDKFILNEENVLKIKPFISNLIHNNCCEGFSYVDEQLYNFIVVLLLQLSYKVVYLFMKKKNSLHIIPKFIFLL